MTGITRRRRDTAVAISVTSITRRRRDGFTLLELVVVLALMGLAIAVVAPSFVLRPPNPDESLKRVVASARRTAMQRAQTVRLDMDAAGRWQVSGADRGEGEVLLSGELDERPIRDMHLRITPLGLCLTQADSGTARGVAFNPFTCSPADRREQRP